MRKNIRILTISVFSIFLCFLVLLVVSAAVGRVGLTHGQSFSLDQNNLSTPVTVIDSESGTSNADVKTTLKRKTLGVYVNAGSTLFNVVANKTYTAKWDTSGTKKTQAIWENTETSVGYVVIATFYLKE